MKLGFRGWHREVFEHEHVVKPVTYKKQDNLFKPGKGGEPLIWDKAFRAYGKVDDLGLTGSFLVQIDFEESELRTWLTKYIRSKPQAATRLLAEMQGEANIALARQSAQKLQEKLVIG